MEAHGAEVGRVAVLSPYRAQVALLERAFRAAHGAAALAAVEFGTIDGFQVPAVCDPRDSRTLLIPDACWPQAEGGSTMGVRMAHVCAMHMQFAAASVG
jgi:hypothetical protein